MTRIEPNLSHRALTAAAIEARPDRVCPECGDRLDPSKRSDAVYCGNECRGLQRVRTWRGANRVRSNENARRYQARRYESDPAYRAAKIANAAVQWPKWRARREDAEVVGVDVGPAAVAARWDYYGGRCYLCGGLAESTDHVIPLALGGLHIPANLRPACIPCNSSKGSGSLDSFYARKAEREVSETG